MLIGTENKLLGPNLARYGPRMQRKLYLCVSSSYLWCSLLNKENRGHATPGFLHACFHWQIPIAWSVPMLAGRKNKPLECNVASYGSRTPRKELMYLFNLCLQYTLLKKRIEAPLCPDFYGSDLSAVNSQEMRAVLAGTKNKPFRPSLARYGFWTWRKLYLYVYSLFLTCSLLKKENRGHATSAFLSARPSW